MSSHVKLMKTGRPFRKLFAASSWMVGVQNAPCLNCPLQSVRWSIYELERMQADKKGAACNYVNLNSWDHIPDEFTLYIMVGLVSYPNPT